MAIDLSKLPDKSDGIDLSKLPDKSDAIDLSGLPDKPGFSPSTKILMASMEAIKTPWQQVQEGISGGIQKAAASPAGQEIGKVAGQAEDLIKQNPALAGAVAPAATAVSLAKDAYKAYSSALVGIQENTTKVAIQKGIDPYIAHFAGMAASFVADFTAQAVGMGVAGAAMGGMEESLTARNMLKDSVLQLDEKQAQDVSKLVDASPEVKAQREAETRRQENLQYNLDRNATPSDQLKGPAKLGSTYDTRYVQRDPIEKTTITRSGPLKPSEPVSSNDKILLGARQGSMVPGDPDTGPPLSAYAADKGPTADFGRKIELSPSKERPASIPIEVPADYTGESWSKSYYKPKETKIVKPGGVFGEPLTPENSIQTASGPIETVSHETKDLPRTVSTLWGGADPTPLNATIDRAVNEAYALSLRLELEAPHEDPAEGLNSVYQRAMSHQWIGRLDTDKMIGSYADVIPDRSRRTLVTMYSQLGRAPTMEEIVGWRNLYADKKSAEAKQMFKDLDGLLKGNDLSLNPHEMGGLKSYENYLEGMGQGAQKMGVLGTLRENYGGPQLYMSEEDADKNFVKRLITGKSKFAIPRQFDNFSQAMEAGFLPKTLDSAQLMGIYHQGITKSLSERFFISALEKHGLVNYIGDGEPVRSIRSMSFTAKDGTKYERMAFTQMPEVASLSNRITEDFGSLEKYTRLAERWNALTKATQTWSTVFHPKALATEAWAAGFNPLDYKKGLELFDKNPDVARSIIRAGLTYEEVDDWGERLVKVAGEQKGIPNPLEFVQKTKSITDDIVFKKFMFGSKIYYAYITNGRILEMGGGRISPERAMQLAVTDANIKFGGLNIEQAARSKNIQRIFKLVAYAKDWTEAKARQAVGVAGPLYNRAADLLPEGARKYAGTAPTGYESFIGKLSPEEEKIMFAQSRNTMVRLMGIAIGSHIIDQHLNPFNKMLGGAFSVDLEDESGYKDYKKMYNVMRHGDLGYFTSKASTLVRDFATMMDTRTPTLQKLWKVTESTFPFPVQKFLKAQQ